MLPIIEISDSVPINPYASVKHITLDKTEMINANAKIYIKVITFPNKVPSL